MLVVLRPVGHGGALEGFSPLFQSLLSSALSSAQVGTSRDGLDNY
jgi:hypothetical protein